MRLRPASSAASEKRLNERVTPGKVSEVVVKRTSSVPKKEARTAAAAPLKVLCPEVYDGKGGVVSSGAQLGSGAVSGLPSRSASWMAVTGRQKAKLYLQSQQVMPASARAMLSRANRRALSASALPRCRATSWAMRFQCPGGVTVPASSAQK